jgi:signal transduction histidine kinase
MKLTNKISRYFLFSSLFLFIIIYIGLYYIIEQSIRKEADAQLKHITAKVLNEVKMGSVVNYPPYIEINSINPDSIESKKPYYEDVLIDFEDGDDNEPFRQRISYVQLGDSTYEVIARISMKEKNSLFESISIVIFSGIFLFLIVMFFINRLLSHRVFNDFYQTLDKISAFSLISVEEIQLNKSNIEEFEKLNTAIKFLANKAQNEYKSLKEFTEELNHEIQTPIAVIKAKLELLIQNMNWDEDDLSILEIALKNLTKLEKINKSILLLNKLENINSYEINEINLKEEIQTVLDFYADFINAKNIKVKNKETTHNKPKFNANSSLFNILLNNLFSNAIKHNVAGGDIVVKFDDSKQNATELIISNTSLPPKNDTKNFFKRFYKESDSPESIGLGLTIVKKICEIYKIKINNYYKDGFYFTQLLFPKK